MEPLTRPLMMATETPDDPGWGESLAKALGKGRLLRLRRGIYVPAALWFHCHPSQRYQLMLAAAHHHLRSPVFCRESALVAHGLPLLTVPQKVHVRKYSASSVRTISQPSLTGRLSSREFWTRALDHGATQGVSYSDALFRGFSTAGHSVPQGSVPKRTVPKGSAPEAREHPVEQRKLVLPSLDGSADGTHPLPVRTEPMQLALVDTLSRLDFEHGLVPLEAALRQAGARSSERIDQLHQSAEQTLVSARARRRVEQLLDFASPLSESPGESLARARFRQLGFEQPQLQVSISIDGATYRVDFLWETAGVVAEFDGWKKYDQGFTAAMQQEKAREDAIRSTGLLIVRFYWEDLMQPGCTRLVQLLTRARVPRITQD